MKTLMRPVLFGTPCKTTTDWRCAQLEIKIMESNWHYLTSSQWYVAVIKFRSVNTFSDQCLYVCMTQILSNEINWKHMKIDSCKVRYEIVNFKQLWNGYFAIRFIFLFAPQFSIEIYRSFSAFIFIGILSKCTCWLKRIQSTKSRSALGE